jgi:hypothetical protein
VNRRFSPIVKLNRIPEGIQCAHHGVIGLDHRESSYTDDLLGKHRIDGDRQLNAIAGSSSISYLAQIVIGPTARQAIGTAVSTSAHIGPSLYRPAAGIMPTRLRRLIILLTLQDFALLLDSLLSSPICFPCFDSFFPVVTPIIPAFFRTFALVSSLSIRFVLPPYRTRTLHWHFSPILGIAGRVPPCASFPPSPLMKNPSLDFFRFLPSNFLALARNRRVLKTNY